MAEDFLELVRNEAMPNDASPAAGFFIGSKPWLLGVVVTGVLLLAAMPMWLLWKGNTVTDAQLSSKSLTPADTKAFYVAMPRPFLFNLAAANRTALVEIKVQLMVRGRANSLLVNRHIPLIEDALLTIFSSSDLADLSTQSGKDEMRLLALKHLQNTLAPILGDEIVEQVLFTGFIIQ